ncbi:tRNA preQ1(34) S-adenosylmethionine ribosyltransferase-isomerase QueA [Labrys sp. WJW]|uniref:tRNA preQ1(34) S-adenosylmethionine ribosyltransferase-isomerase QueA n=1 Tax=Labrys sp. WJW TaxID=1737983 RepID=UPI00082CD30A|nr:tRNA preQ1(34) S-adenosylmethionine ribosyltransferase-isomerase QueA [Labrys sp. WJW]OCC01781.1 tRNA preQ1(34) S-adenosylmethionine ribosyltransferase-isomerase QueA [Labrys sp. WJW]
MRVSDFDFHLPAENIALRPAEPRDQARLLEVDPLGNTLADRTVSELPTLLRAGDMLVFNDTKVIPARLDGLRRRPGGAGATIEAMLHQRLGPAQWKAFARPGKRLAVGDTIEFGEDLSAAVEEKGEGGEVTLRFSLESAELDVAIATVGHIPLPPYIASKRAEDAQDREDYQTIYAKADGAVAAPTAGLHFTPDLFARLDAAGIARHFVTLHVGAGTFLPVKGEDLSEHKMHAEFGVVTAETAQALNEGKARGGRIIAVGTTSLRLLESAAAADEIIKPFAGETSIFITPGHDFRTADALMTNFHLPRSTLMMLVSAFAGYDTMKAAYAHAIATGYRFYSYGDASLLWRAPC